MSELAAQDRASKRNKPRMAADDIVSANGLATHLGMSRQNVARLTAEAVIEQRGDGRYDQTASRLRYIKHLRSEHRHSPRSAADAAHASAKARLLELKIAKEEQLLMTVEEHTEIMSKFVGLVLTKLGGMPIRVAGSDLIARRKAEAVVFELRTEIADQCQQWADESKPQ